MIKSKFEVTGLFYLNKGYPCRKFLDIKRQESTHESPDLIVVMMNPGSSFPLDGIDNSSTPSAAEPDKTQEQIMRLMDNASLNYARVLNLSDLRTPKSSDLLKFLKSNKSKDVDHSIFSASRKTDLDLLFVPNVPVVFGWGVDEALAPLAKQAITTLRVEKPLGKFKTGTEYSYYHPLPRTLLAQQEWVQLVSDQLLRSSG